ncbi:protein-export chaperone SecB [Pseudomonas sp. S 311-6]|nr:protein-export chaperone SecB [Pseudomonas sp. S 311-6]
MKQDMTLHPIQLMDVTIHKLDLVINDPRFARDYEGELSLNIEIGRSDFSADDPDINIGLRVQTEPITENSGSSEEECVPPFSIEVEIQGHFHINLSEFPEEHVEEWAKINAPFLLLPYAREQVYGLAIRAGIRGLLFPLFVQPRATPKKI